MAVLVPPIVYRIVKGSPLTALEGDSNLRKLSDFCNALSALFGVALNPDGSLKSPPIVYGVSAAGSNDYQFTPSPAVAAMSELIGRLIVLKSDFSNTGAVTLQIAALGAQPIKKFSNQALEPNDIKSGQLVFLSWDGTNFQMQSQPAVVQKVNYVQDTGIVNAYIAAQTGTVNIPTALYAGYQVSVKIATTNTGASTLQIGGLAAAAIKKNVATALAAGDLQVGQVVDFIYDGTNFQMVSGIRNPFADLGAQAMPAGLGTLTFAHTLSNFPSYVRAVLQPKTGQTDNGYSDTMQVEMSSCILDNAGGDIESMTSVVSTTSSVSVSFPAVGTGNPMLNNPTTGVAANLDRTKWNVKVYVNNG